MKYYLKQNAGDFTNLSSNESAPCPFLCAPVYGLILYQKKPCMKVVLRETLWLAAGNSQMNI